MSILNRSINNEQPGPAKITAERLLSMTKQTFDQMVMAFNEGSIMFWENRMGASPEDIAAELGTDAAELFSLHAKLGSLILQVNPDSIEKGLSVVGNFITNQDGTITVTPKTNTQG